MQEAEASSESGGFLYVEGWIGRVSLWGYPIRYEARALDPEPTESELEAMRGRLEAYGEPSSETAAREMVAMSRRFKQVLTEKLERAWSRERCAVCEAAENVRCCEFGRVA